MNRKAAERTIEAMQKGGLLEEVDSALLEAVLGLAEAVDNDPANASLWREYRAAMNDLRGLNDGSSDAFDLLMASLRPAVRDPED